MAAHEQETDRVTGRRADDGEGSPAARLAGLPRREDEYHPGESQQQADHPCRPPVTDACAAAGFSPDFAATPQDYATAQGFVAACLGVSLVPQLGLSAPHPGVAIRRVRRSEPVRAIHAVCRAGSLEQPVLHTLLDAFRESGGVGRPTPEAEGRVAPRTRSSS
ncbi:LysR substrate-binding domain-containing protein [Streptomyces sp. SKN60]|uniref:LysR substrate-binding domain-containing protein n=1 Tax=Streptomyces sp. SKN60 TaxID=2855506 RepID=UPI002247DC6A|nr:LysR substrate-binding domain-containing protein [Streptomyces sp. SKN60]